MNSSLFVAAAVWGTLSAQTAIAADLSVQVTNQPSFFDADVVTLGFRVCNAGNAPADPSRVAFHLSSDDALDPTDAPFGDAWVAFLSAGACLDGVVSGSVGLSGAVRILAVADADAQVVETDESNNLFVGRLTGSGFGFDLLVDAVRPSSLTGLGQVEVDLCNVGPDFAPSASLEVLASSDASIVSPGADPLSSDVLLGSTQVFGVAPKSCVRVEVPVSTPGVLPGPALAGYVGAVVAGVPGEVVDTNNTTVSETRSAFVTAPQIRAGRLDAKVRAATGELVVSGQLCNDGDTEGSPSIEIYASVDTVLDRPDTNPSTPDYPLGQIAAPGPIPPQRCFDFERVFPMALPGPGVNYLLLSAELPEDPVPEDNVGVSNPVAAGTPNLVVTSVDAGFDFFSNTYTLAAEVCNEGDIFAPGVPVEFVTSFDASIEDPFVTGAVSDLPVSTASLEPLEPGRCAVAVANASFLPVPFVNGPIASAEGFVGARVDPYRNVGEVLLDDNARATPAVLGGEADVGVNSVEVEIVDYSTREAVARVEVCSEGPSLPGSFSLEVLLSADPFIEDPRLGPAADLPLATVEVREPLPPGTCRVVSISIPSLPLPVAADGSYVAQAYVGARLVLEPAVDRRNDVGRAGPLSVGAEPNLVVTRVDRETVFGDQGFEIELSAEVCNRGFESAGAFDVDFVLSADAAIEPPLELSGYYQDFPITRAPFFGSLEPGRCGEVSIRVFDIPLLPFDPSEARVTYVGASVDPDRAILESVETDNTLATGPEPAGREANVYVAGGSWSYDVQTGNFSYAARVCNDGLSDASGVDVTFVVSADELIEWDPALGSVDDLAIASTQIPQLPVLRCADVVVEGPLPVPGGGFTGSSAYLGVVARGRTDANPSDDTAIIASDAPVLPLPNLVVQRLEAKSSGLPNLERTLTAEVCNRGLTPSPAAEVRFYTSEDRQVDPLSGFDFEFGAQNVTSLQPNACEVVELTLSGGLPVPGYGSSVFVGAVVDAYGSIEEVLETDNVSPVIELPAFSDPDLAITRAVRVGVDANLYQVRYAVEVCNFGLSEASAFDLEVILSEDAHFGDGRDGDFLAAAVSYPGLRPGGCFEQQVGVLPGPFFLPGEGPFVAFRADPYETVNDPVRSNNLRLAGRYGDLGQGDIEVRSVSTRIESANGVTERVFDVEVCDAGLFPLGGFEVSLVLSADEDLETSYFGAFYQDFEIARLTSTGLTQGTCEVLSYRAGGPLPPLPSVVASAAPVEAAFFGARVETFGLDGYAPNDARVSASRVGLGAAPDLRFESLREDVVLSNGIPEKRVRARVCNDGFSPSGRFVVDIYLSEDDQIDDASSYSPDPILTSFSFPSLRSGACRTRGWRSSAGWPTLGPSTEATLGAVVAVGVGDPNPDNDRATVSPVGTGPDPDLWGRKIDVSVLSTEVSVSVVVCNYGLTPSGPSELELVASADDVIERFSPYDVILASASFGGLNPRRCRRVRMKAPLPYVTDPSGNVVTTPVLGALIDPNDGLFESVESNNVVVSAPVSLP